MTDRSIISTGAEREMSAVRAPARSIGAGANVAAEVPSATRKFDMIGRVHKGEGNVGVLSVRTGGAEVPAGRGGAEKNLGVVMLFLALSVCHAPTPTRRRSQPSLLNEDTSFLDGILGSFSFHRSVGMAAAGALVACLGLCSSGFSVPQLPRGASRVEQPIVASLAPRGSEGRISEELVVVDACMLLTCARRCGPRTLGPHTLVCRSVADVFF